MSQDVELLESLSRLVLQAGLRPAVVAARWSALSSAFLGFDPGRVAQLTAAQVELLAAQPALLRHRQKLWAVVENARVVVQLQLTHGSASAWLRLLGQQPYEARLRSMGAVFHRVGPRTAHLLLESQGLASTSDWQNWQSGLAAE